MRPAVKRIARDCHLSLAVLDAARRPGLVRGYGLRTLPALLLLEGERIVRRWEGFRSALEIRDELEKAGEGPRIDR
ncbi:MAG: hypothetical protein ACM3XS_08265, partial [Bacteroidota bacterium]